MSSTTFDVVVQRGGPAKRRWGPLALSDTDREHAIVSLWILVTFVQFPKDELILYPLALYFAYACVRDWPRIARLLGGGWPLLLVTTWSLLCVIWAAAPFAAAKQGLMTVLTIMICFFAAAWLDQRRMMLSVYGAAALIGVLSLGNLSSTGASSGVFAHKNMLGANMVLLWVAALCVGLDRGAARWIRLSTPVALALAFFLILKSQSATALVVAAGSAGLVVGGALFAREQSIMTLSRLGALALMTALGFAAVGAVAATLRDDPVVMLFDALGKDSTLTGRTDLWNYASEQIAERPLLGLGNGGFWNYWASPLVQRIYAEFYKLPHHGFTFHNSFYEIAVHLGLVGLGLALLALAWATLRIVVAALARGGMPRIFFFAIMVICIIRSFVESDLLRPFVLLPMLSWIGALLTVKEQQVPRGRGRGLVFVETRPANAATRSPSPVADRR